MNHWTQELQLEFLEAFQREPIIWDPEHATHKDKKKVHDAWGRIENEIGKPIKELKSKKDSLMATYRGYCRKIAASIMSGASEEDVYKPVWFAFELMNKFLGSVYNCGASINSEEVVYISEGVESDYLPVDNDNEKWELQQMNSRSTTGKTIRRRADPLEPHDAPKQMKNTYCDSQNTIYKNNDVEDECDIFGKLIAKKLKRLSEDDKEDVMFEIQTIFHNRSVQRRSCRIPLSSSS